MLLWVPLRVVLTREAQPIALPITQAFAELLGGVDPRVTGPILNKALDLFSEEENKRTGGAMKETNGERIRNVFI